MTEKQWLDCIEYTLDKIERDIDCEYCPAQGDPCQNGEWGCGANVAYQILLYVMKRKGITR